MGYFEIKAMSASAIKAGAISMLNMQKFFERGTESSAAMIRGSLRHMAVKVWINKGVRNGNTETTRS